MAQRLTDKLVKDLGPPAEGNRITYDEAVKGFGIRVTAAGGKSFVLNYRRKSDGRERRYTIGAFPTWTVAAAREEAKRLKRLVDGGGDPVGEDAAQRAAPTVNDLCDLFVAEHIEKRRASTTRDYRSMIQNDIRPALGRMKVATVEFEDVERLHRSISKRAQYRANRVVSLLSRMFAVAHRLKWRADNPAKGVERNHEAKRKRYLSGDELRRLAAALDAHPDQQAANVLRLLLLTGARCGEVLAATWDQFDLGAGTWTKPYTATKQRRDHQIPLSAPARQLLASIRKAARDEFVFPGRKPGTHRTELKYAWPKVCRAAGITGLRIHDLRHSYASQLVSAGFSLPVIGALLGHSQVQTTARYAHLFDDVQRKATETVGAILSGQPSGEVVPLKGGRS
jgi:integrase